MTSPDFAPELGPRARPSTLSMSLKSLGETVLYIISAYFPNSSSLSGDASKRGFGDLSAECASVCPQCQSNCDVTH